MAGRVLYKYIGNVAGVELVKPIALSETTKNKIEELIKRKLAAEEITSISVVLYRVSILMTAELANNSMQITSQDIKRTLTNISKLAPCKALQEYQKVGIIRDIIDEVMRMELNIHYDRGSDDLMLSLGLDMHNTSQEFTNALGNNIKKAAAIALERYPYTPLNPRPDHLQRNGKPAIGLPIKPEKGGKPTYRYRQKLAKYALNLWTQLGMDPCKSWQWGEKETPTVKFMDILARVIEPPIDSKDIARLLKADGQWKYISPEEPPLL